MTDKQVFKLRIGKKPNCPECDNPLIVYENQDVKLVRHVSWCCFICSDKPNYSIKELKKIG